MACAFCDSERTHLRTFPSSCTDYLKDTRDLSWTPHHYELHVCPECVPKWDVTRPTLGTTEPSDDAKALLDHLDLDAIEEIDPYE